MKNDLPEIDVVFDADTIADRIETLATEIADKLPDDLLIVVVLKAASYLPPICSEDWIAPGCAHASISLPFQATAPVPKAPARWN